MGSGIVPSKQQDAINFFANRLTLWAANAAVLNLSAANLTAIANAVNAAQTALAAAEVARNASKSATVALEQAMQTLRTLGGDLVKAIRTTAEVTGNPAIYTLSNLPPPATPSPLGAPPIPTNFSAVLNNAGEIELRWTCTRVGGTSFTIQRSITGAPNSWSIIGTSEKATFTDSAVPVGLASIQYRVIASRSGGSSTPTAPSVVLFGNTSQQQQQTGGSGLTLAA